MSAVQVRGSWRGNPPKSPLKGEGIPLNNFRILSDGQIQPLHYGAAICEGFTGHLKYISVDLSTQGLNYHKRNKHLEREAPSEAGEQYPKARETSLAFCGTSPCSGVRETAGKTLLEFCSFGSRLTTALLLPSLRAG